MHCAALPDDPAPRCTCTCTPRRRRLKSRRAAVLRRGDCAGCHRARCRATRSRPESAPAHAAIASQSQRAAAVSAEDTSPAGDAARLSRMLLSQRSSDVRAEIWPTLVPARGTALAVHRPTRMLVPDLTAADLERYGALNGDRTMPALLRRQRVRRHQRARSISVGPICGRSISTAAVAASRTIVAWGGNLVLRRHRQPPDDDHRLGPGHRLPLRADRGDGRSYIREVGRPMTLADVRVSSLGFWSGRTGGWRGPAPAASRAPAAPRHRRSSTTPTARSSHAAHVRVPARSFRAQPARRAAHPPVHDRRPGHGQFGGPQWRQRLRGRPCHPGHACAKRRIRA